MKPINYKNIDKNILPKDFSDKEKIDSFLLKNSNKKIIVVQGLGFVGSVMSIVCANAINEEYAVIGVDLPNKGNYWKIKSINEGHFPIISSDDKVQEYYDKSMTKGNFYATYDEYAYSVADTIIVDINLDVYKVSDEKNNLNSYDVDLSAFKKAIFTIGNNCKEDVLILVETTVPPGTCETIVKPIIKKLLINRNLSVSHYKIAHSYERVMPGPDYIDSIQNFYRVYSGVDEKSANEAENFLKTIIHTNEFPLTRLGNTNATEMAKVLENSYRAMNIAFAVEWTRFAEESGVNLYEVVDAIRMRPTHNNLMYPGIGVGGYCLTKDPLLASWSRKNIFNSSIGLTQSEQGVKINDKMPLYAYEFMKKELKNLDLKGKNILLLGVSYRSNVGDTRFTPVEHFYNFLLNDNFNIFIHDPYVRFWEEKEIVILDNFKIAFEEEINIVVLSTAHSDYINSLELIESLDKQKKLFIYDTVGVLSKEEIDNLSNKHVVRVLGRGDIN